MKANKIIIVPETHWDREWYLPFQEFRARLVIMMDKLLNILKTDSNYRNFTFDGQVIPIEDYLEVRPDKEEEIKEYVKQGRLSIGPMYALPDEFLVSGESIIRNLMIGHQISRRFGRVMKAGYIPDPFGHIAQLPQIIQGFEIPSI
ncbi:MAG: glycoside hydrolase, partial [Candidatus Lokiarchaeota archaeon]|nr:glycoside hydrolase [Candidatus Lokiarchaeota archaeon]